MQKEKAIVLIQTVKKGVSRQQVEAMIASKLAEYDNIVSEDGAVDMVLQDLGLAAKPSGAESPTESFADRKARMEAEPEGGNFLKSDKVAVGDQVKITAVSIEGAKEIQTKRGPVTLPSRPQVTGKLKAKGAKEWGVEVKFSLNKSNEKNLYGLWGKSLDECVGLVMMVSAVEHKVINGGDASWISWTGLPE
jgi:hypothetical protein